MIISILIMVAVLSLLVFIHELGHFIAARRSGVEVSEFGFGFPPRIFGFKKGKTVFSVNWIPLGGFVRMKGEDLHDKSAGGFGAAPFRKKTKILLAGVAMNALFGYLLVFYLALTGLPPLPNIDINRSGSTYAQVPKVVVLQVNQGLPADKAGIKKGDTILSGNRQPFDDPEKLKAFTKDHAGQVVVLEVRRRNETTLKTVQLDKGTKEGGQLGLLPFQTYLLKFGLGGAFSIANQLFVKILGVTLIGVLSFFKNVPSLTAAVFKAPVPEASAVGPIGLTVIIGNIIFLGWRFLAMVAVSITYSLAVLNLFPIPILDGGRFVIVALAEVRRKALSKKLEAVIFGVSYLLLAWVFLLILVLDFRRFL